MPRTTALELPVKRRSRGAAHQPVPLATRRRNQGWSLFDLPSPRTDARWSRAGVPVPSFRAAGQAGCLGRRLELSCLCAHEQWPIHQTIRGWIRCHPWRNSIQMATPVPGSHRYQLYRRRWEWPPRYHPAPPQPARTPSSTLCSTTSAKASHKLTTHSRCAHLKVWHQVAM